MTYFLDRDIWWILSKIGHLNTDLGHTERQTDYWNNWQGEASKLRPLECLYNIMVCTFNNIVTLNYWKYQEQLGIEHFIWNLAMLQIIKKYFKEFSKLPHICSWYELCLCTFVLSLFFLIKFIFSKKDCRKVLNKI